MLAGCSFLGGDPEPSRLDLTVQNTRERAVDAEVTVTGDDGTVYLDVTDRIDAGVARAFETAVGTEGRREVTVAGSDWEGGHTWDAGTCAVFDATVRVTPTSVETDSGCPTPR